MFVERNKISEESGSRTSHPVVFLEKLLDMEETDSSTKSQGDTIYCNGYPRVKYRMKKHGTDNCTGIFNFFLRREIPYTNADSVV